MTAPETPVTPGPSLGDLAERVARTHPSQIALAAMGTGARITYETLADVIDDTAIALSGNGFDAGDVIGLRTGNNLGYVVGLLGAARAGLVTVPLDPALPHAEQQIRLQRVGARAVLTDQPIATADPCPDVLIDVSA